MRRVVLRLLFTVLLIVVLLIGGTGYGQSLGEAARASRKQKSTTPAKVFTTDDLVAPSNAEIIQSIPGFSSIGQGTLVAPGKGKHGYRVIVLDASRFVNGGDLQITVTVGTGESEGSFDLFPQGAPLPSEGYPHTLANAENVHRASDAMVNYHFLHGAVFQFGLEGSWNSKLGATNTYRFVAKVASR